MILLPAETLGRKLNHTDSLCRKLFSEHNSPGRKQETKSNMTDSLGKKGKLADIVYTPWLSKIYIVDTGSGVGLWPLLT